MKIHVVQPGDTLRSIAATYQVSLTILIQDNEVVNPDQLVPGQTIIILYPEQTYTVQQGDTLTSIANSYSVSLMQLLRNNPHLSSQDYIYPGEELIISYNTTSELTTIGFAYPYIDHAILKKTLPYLTYLSVFNYRATSEGQILSLYDDSAIIQTAKDYDTIPLVLLTTLTERGEADLEVAYQLLLNEQYQEIQIDNIINVIREKGYYGINFVFYFMSTANQNLYQKFITKASERIKKEGYIVVITINPNIEFANNQITDEKDYSTFGKVADFVTFLQFIWGTNYGPPAPVTSIAYQRSIVNYALVMVPPEKFVVGCPLIAYDWALPYYQSNQPAVSLTIDSAIRLAQDEGVMIQYDETSMTPYFEYNQAFLGSSIPHIVWFVDARTLDALTQLIDEYELKGAGIWNIMGYSPQLWLILNSKYEIIKYKVATIEGPQS